MEAEFIPLLLRFGYDQLRNYVKNKHLSIDVRGEEEGIFNHVFILETLTWLYYVGNMSDYFLQGFLMCGPPFHPSTLHLRG